MGLERLRRARGWSMLGLLAACMAASSASCARSESAEDNEASNVADSGVDANKKEDSGGKVDTGQQEPEDTPDAGNELDAAEATDTGSAKDASLGGKDSSVDAKDAAVQQDSSTKPSDASVKPDTHVQQDAKADAPRPLPVLDSLVERCKLISNRNLDDPTQNDTHYRANLRGTDLGISVAHGNDLYIFFGDTAGAQKIWPLGPESLPDAVGYSAVPWPNVANDPSTLCTNLRFLLTGGKTGNVEGDFAGASMQPPPGHAIGEYIHNPAGPRGKNMFPNLPGDFEVPSGAFSYGGSIYIFYTIINHEPFEMRGSYLAKWDSPQTNGKPNYRILYHVDQRFNSNGALRGDFINIAAVVDGPYVYLYGTGKYRASPVHLARKLLSQIDTEGGFERFDAKSSKWVPPNAAASPIVGTPAIGELSVQHYPSIGRYVMMDQEPGIIVARFADKPEGPWSSGTIVAAMANPLFAARYCCINNDCFGERLMNCDRAGFYGTYMLPEVKVNPNGSFSITFTMSTWDPYNVALMTANFR